MAPLNDEAIFDRFRCTLYCRQAQRMVGKHYRGLQSWSKRVTLSYFAELHPVAGLPHFALRSH